jgi:hypothetical protein
MGAVTKSYMRKGFLIYEEMRKYLTIHFLRRPLVIYEFVSSYMRKIEFSFYKCGRVLTTIADAV